MSDDPKQEFFCDGITEEIITALSSPTSAVTGALIFFCLISSYLWLA